MRRGNGNGEKPLRSVAEGIANELFTLRRLAVVIVAVLGAGCLLAGASVYFVRQGSSSASSAASAAREGKKAADEARATTEFVKGCVDPQGECGARLAAGSAGAAEQRKRDLQQSLQASQDAQAAESARLLSAVQGAVAQLEVATADRDELRDQVTQLLAEVASLRAQLAALQAAGAKVAVAPPPPPTLCATLGTLGVVLGCT